MIPIALENKLGLKRHSSFRESSGSSPQSNYATQLQQSREETVSLEYILIMFAIFAVVLLCGVFLAMRFRERCIQVVLFTE